AYHVGFAIILFLLYEFLVAVPYWAFISSCCSKCSLRMPNELWAITFSVRASHPLLV
uniref:Uncharacterized protein n=1 Tax=Oryza brachyantha TaxID=4533 RepID=J3LCW5_ORYBR